MIDIFEYYGMLKKFGIDIIYSGPLWADGINGIGDTLRKRLAFDELPLSASQSVFSVFVEQMNNMLMYSAEKETPGLGDGTAETSKGVFILGSMDKSYFIQSGNIIKNDNIELIKARLDYLNTLDKAEMRSYFKQQIKAEDTNPESKGAGIGFIEIARRASAPIEYSFTPIEEGLTFFSMLIKIG